MIPYFILDQFSLGPVKIYTWGLFVGLGFSAGYLLFYYLAKKESLAPAKIAGPALAIFAGALLGAKVLAVAQLPGGLFKNINLIFSQHSGAMFLGGVLGAILFGWGYIKLAKLNLWRIADLLVLPMALGIGIGRIACVLTNEHQGALTSLPWGILWPDGTLRHPVGIYEALVGFGLLAAFRFLFFSPPQLRGRLRGGADSGILVLARDESLTKVRTPDTTSPSSSSTKGERIDGRMFLLFLISYSAIRFFLEFTRVASGPLADPRWGVFSVSQWLALLIIAGSLLFFIKKVVK